MLMTNAVKEAKDGNVSIKEKFNKIASAFANGSEFSQQEMVYVLLSMLLSKCSRKVIYINTIPKDERIKMTKWVTALKLLDWDSEDVFISGIIDHYIKRSKILNELSLADFCSKYDYRSKNAKATHEDYSDDSDPKMDNNSKFIKLNENAGYFGGNSIICFGDFMQLQPVGDRFIFKPDLNNPFVLSGAALWLKFYILNW